MNNRLIKSNDAGGGDCTNTVDLYNPFPDGGGVALYQLNGDATDVSGNYDGTASNVTYGAGQFGQAGVFNGSSSYINTNLSLSFNSAKTISIWFKVDSLQNSVLFEAGPNTPYWGYSLVTVNDGRFYFIINNSNHSGFIGDYTTGATYTTGVWHNVVSTMDGNTQKTYLNGSEIGSLSYSTTSESYPIYLAGGSPSGFSPLLNGSIDQVRIFNRALRPYEVEALYTEEYCTPTIVPSEHFNTVLYTGTGATNSITGVGFQPDMVWMKSRSTADWHMLCDSVRGLAPLFPNATDNEGGPVLVSYDSDGFTTTSNGTINGSGKSLVAWNFKAGGAAVTNTDGTITSQVSANTEAGFSIVSYTTPTTNNFTVGHGLNDTPKIIIIKGRSLGSSWTVYSSEIGASNYLQLNSTNGSNASSLPFNNTAPTDSVFTAGSSTVWYGTNAQYIAYCFAEVEGFSSFGSYVGTGASGNTVVTGFEPAFVMLKSTSATGNWRMWDNKRTLQNPRNNVLIANGSNAEFTNDVAIEFLENGFSFLGSGSNDSGASFIYMAFAADPTTVEPTLEDSFNTVTYTGAGSNQQVTGVGFQPDLVWIKNRDTTNTHTLHDTIRGIGNQIASNTTGVEQDETAYFTGVGDGFLQFGLVGGNYNTIGQDYVAWAWKGAELPAINSNGSIPSVVSANPAAGFSIVSYTGNGQDAQTVGHGLGNTPSIVITKNRNKNGNLDGNWAVAYIPGVTAGYLNLTAGFDTGRFDALFGSGINDNTFTVSTGGAIGYGHTNGANDAIIAYCFAEVAGFSKFGSYTGNGSTNGPTITTGFEPAFVMIKRTNTNANWVMKDIKRGDLASLYPNLSDAEYTVYDEVDFLSDGFQLKSNDISSNSNSSTYIYMAFANQF